MHILALETSGLAGSVAALDDDNVLANIDLPQEAGISRALAPAIQQILAAVGWQPKEIQLVAVVIGPGSFTGLRVGVTTAKTLAYATGAQVLGLDTLEVVAAAAPPEVARLSVAIDAQRGDVVAADFVRGPDGSLGPAAPFSEPGRVPSGCGSGQLVGLETWWSMLSPGTLVAGPVLPHVISRLPKHLVAIEPDYWFPKAAAAGRLAARLYAAGRRDDLWTLAPRYARPSAAEEKKNCKSKAAT